MVVDFLRRVAKDPQFRGQLTNEADSTLLLEKLRKAGYDFSLKEFTETLRNLKDTPDKTLSDEALEDITGGLSLRGCLAILTEVIAPVGGESITCASKDACGSVTDGTSDQLARGIRSVVGLFS